MSSPELKRMTLLAEVKSFVCEIQQSHKKFEIDGFSKMFHEFPQTLSSFLECVSNLLRNFCSSGKELIR